MNETLLKLNETPLIVEVERDHIECGSLTRLYQVALLSAEVAQLRSYIAEVGRKKMLVVREHGYLASQAARLAGDEAYVT